MGKKMRKFIVLNANRLSFIIITILLIGEVLALVKEQSTWNIVYVIMLSISWLSFLLLVLVKPKTVGEE
ncbi:MULTISPECIES: hypothetical protein [unclassified Peribacillus]|uniref:hypothetical protein n=1 Tax=unclassified Peribacillus TaxID=2675266 RepID=UPI001E4DAE3A|nr:hypothetical protein [Peribacillus sp. Bi96]